MLHPKTHKRSRLHRRWRRERRRRALNKLYMFFLILLPVVHELLTMAFSRFKLKFSLKGRRSRMKKLGVKEGEVGCFAAEQTFALSRIFILIWPKNVRLVLLSFRQITSKFSVNKKSYIYPYSFFFFFFCPKEKRTDSIGLPALPTWVLITFIFYFLDFALSNEIECEINIFSCTAFV